jgi:hypothetical protein
MEHVLTGIRKTMMAGRRNLLLRRGIATAVLMWVSLLTVPAQAAPRTDVVILLNDDHFTGEVIQLSYGQLLFKTDDAGTLSIEWNKVATLTTRQVLQAELSNGQRVTGPAPDPAARSAELRVNSVTAGGTTAIEVPMADIVRMVTIDQESFLRRLDGAISVGYSYTQTNNLHVINLSSNLGTRTTKRHWNIALDSQITTQDSAASSQRAVLLGTLERYMPDRYYYEESLEFSRNQQLGLDLRSLIGATLGRYLVQQQGREWRAGAGIAASAERGADGSKRNGLEAQFVTGLRIFRFDRPRSDVTASVTLLPSLTEWGRWRGEEVLKARRELIADLFLELSVHLSHDNQPADGAESTDWGVVTSIGYSF